MDQDSVRLRLAKKNEAFSAWPVVASVRNIAAYRNVFPYSVVDMGSF